MQTHRSFKELCVLSTSGELSREQSILLREHLADCSECRNFLADTRTIANALIPSEDRGLELEQPPSGMRERFLARAKTEGIAIHAGPVLVQPTPKPSELAAKKVKSSPRPSAYGLPPLAQRWQAWTLLGGACAACFLVGVVFQPRIEGKWRAIFGKPTTPAVAVVTTLPPASRSEDSNRRQLVALTAERDQLAVKIAALNDQLETLKKQKEASEDNFSAKLASTQSTASTDHETLTQQNETLRAQTADLESQLNALRQKQSLLEADLHTERTRATEYEARFELAQKVVSGQPAPIPDSGPGSSASRGDGSEIGALVAARNLHIIDVYDSNAVGARQRAFGRVFYVEGRSLVFYAFDLSAPHSAKNITFHLWGEKAGQKETTLSLGVLHDDDPAERRWALTFDDPKVLAKINSVYVTAESKPSDQPRGPKVLYAYFGSQPNHP